MRLFRLIEGSLYRSPLLLLREAEPGAPQPQADPQAQKRAYDLGYHHAKRGYNPYPDHPKVADAQAYLAGYSHQKQGMGPGGAQGGVQAPQTAPAAQKPQAPHAVHRTPAGRLVQKRKCFDKDETQQAVQGIDRSLTAIKRSAHISEPHERKIRALQQAASAAHPEDAHKHIGR